MITILLKLILAHLIGDFFLQPPKWVRDKEKKKLRSKWLYVHIAIHLALMLLILWDMNYLPLILTIAAVHLVIDSLKILLQNKRNKRLLFFIDQLLHIATILILMSLFYKSDFEFTISFGVSELLLITCLTFLTLPASFIMRTVFSKWNISKITKENQSLEDAGQYIGVLERLLVFIFIISGQWSAVGFLITAKSVFRFGDLTASKERKLTEYILIGTLISFGIAIITGLIYIYFKSYV